MIDMELFQTVFVCIWDIFLSQIEIYEEFSNSVNFWARKLIFFLNGAEFRQKFIGTIIRGLVQHLRAWFVIKHWIRPLRIKYHISGGEVGLRTKDPHLCKLSML